MTYEERRRKADELFAVGYDLIAEQRYREALRIGKKLVKLGNSGAYDVMSRAHSGLGRWKQAVKTLEEGLKRYPTVAILWSLLGELYSDAGQWPEALAAFEKSAEGHGADRAIADYNAGVVCLRMSDPVRGMQKLALIPPGTKRPRPWSTEHLAVCLLLDLDRVEEAQRSFDQLLDALDDTVTDEERENIKTLATRLGRGA